MFANQKLLTRRSLRQGARAVLGVAAAATLTVLVSTTPASADVLDRPSTIVSPSAAPTTNPPGRCDAEEIGDVRVGPDGGEYVCLPDGVSQERLDALSRDPAEDGKITKSSRKEAEVALQMEQAGVIENVVRDENDPKVPGSGRADFRGNRPGGQMEFYDVKNLGYGSGRTDGISIYNSLHDGLDKIQPDIEASGETVIVDAREMLPEDITQLESAVRFMGWEDRVIFWP